MYSSRYNDGVLRSDESSSNGSNLLARHSFKSTRRIHESGTNISLLSMASEEDDEVQFDSKLSSLSVLKGATC